MFQNIYAEVRMNIRFKNLKVSGKNPKDDYWIFRNQKSVLYQ